jgi:cytochrome c oxidase subunit 2
VPAMGVKVDAVPGRLSQSILIIRRLGILYGQCSELCGVAHGFMPIVIASYAPGTGLDYIENNFDFSISN